MSLAQQTPDPGALGMAYLGLAAHHWCLGEWDTFVELARQSVDHYQSIGDLHWQGFATSFLAVAFNSQGKFFEALVYARDCVRLGKEGADPQVRCWGLRSQGRAQFRLGRFGEAVPALREAVELAEVIPDYLYHVAAGGLLGRCYLRQGNVDLALATLQGIERIFVRHHAGWGLATDLWNGLVEVYLLISEQSDGAGRKDWLKKAGHACRLTLKQGRGARGGLPEAMTLRGCYEWQRGRAAAARTWWRRALALAEEMGQPYERGLVHLEMGRRRGERVHLERAETILSELGAQWDMARARDALAQISTD
jgi:tetratricopeptide (TPR) repeat protein